MLKFEIEGTKSVVNHLAGLVRKIEKLNGTHDVPIADIFTTQFMRKHSRFSSIIEMFEAGGFSVNSQADLDALPKDAIDRLIQQETVFTNWEEMLNAASFLWVKKQI